MIDQSERPDFNSQRKANLVQALSATVGLIIFIILVAVLGIWGIDKQAKVNCLKWQKEAQTLPDYYILQWQKDQCETWKIPIDAPVK